YHLLLETPDGNLSQIMRHINGAYTNYYNTKRSRAGHLFQGRYKAILVEADEYAVELSRYIHLNPHRAKMVGEPEAYRWSSFKAYIGEIKAPEWLKTDFILGYFGSNVQAKKKYHRFVHELLGEEVEYTLDCSTATAILGSPEFMASIEEKYLFSKEPDRNLPELRKISRRLSLEAIIEEAGSCFGESKQLAAKAGIYISHKYSGARLKEIGERFGIGESAVSQASKRFADKMAEDADLRDLVGKLHAKLRNVDV
ncbi:MAG: transposase, partial [Desulfuromonadaceae bacterium]